MLLTLSNPVKANFEFKSHEYSPVFTPSTVPRSSPKLDRGRRASPAASSAFTMSTSHRGLPPPAAMALPDPGRGPPPMQSTLGSMPPAPSQWQGAEDGMKNWLAAKAEEERRKQEEEKTRQETLRLEQRKIEQSMLRESMQGGIPPHLVPIIFAGISGGNLVNISAEWIQQYASQVQAAHQQVQAQVQTQLSPDLRRDARMIGQPPPAAYAGQSQAAPAIPPPASVLPGQPLPSQVQHVPMAGSGYANAPPLSPRARAAQSAGLVGAPTSAPRPPPPPQSQLPRLTTNEMNIQQPSTAAVGAQQLQQTQTAQQEQSSPSIYFHHWVPPSSSSQPEKNPSGNPPSTPSGKYKTSPIYQTRPRATSHASDADYTSSPKKRKAQGQHQPAPPPTSTPQSFASPQFTHVSPSSGSISGRRERARARSDASPGGPEGSIRPLNRRSTVSEHRHESMARHGDILEEPEIVESKTLPNSEHISPPSRDDDRGRSQPNYTPTSSQPPEAAKYGAQQPWDRGYVSPPKREVGDR